MRATSFLNLKFGNLGLVHQFASAVGLGFGTENASALITALEREASVEVQVMLTSSRIRSSLEGGSCNQFILVGKKTHGCAIAANGWRSESRAMKAAWSSHRHNGGMLCGLFA